MIFFVNIIIYIIYIYIYRERERERENNAKYHFILGVARYTDVTVRYVPRFGGHGSIRFRYNMKKKKSTMLGLFSFILNRQ